MQKVKFYSVCMFLLMVTVIPQLQAAECKKIKAQSSGDVTPHGDTATYDGTISGDPLINGIVHGETSTLVPTQSPTDLAFTSVETFTTQHGTLTLNTAHVINFGLGIISGYLVITGGTGEFEGATGILYIYGTDVNNFFKRQIRGEICLQD